MPRDVSSNAESAPRGRLVRSKPYKAAPPEDTVRSIRSRLMGLGLTFIEQALPGESGRCSYRLCMVNDASGEPVFQTMGKGRTDAYARASAYGEMIERIQNLALYMMLVYSSEPETDDAVPPAPFRYFPDEKILTGEELRQGTGLLARSDLAPDDLPGRTALGVPFWNVFGARAEYLPFRAFQVIVGSNGMCSGNTPSEALVHGICEVFERHVLKQLILSPCTPPEIPLDWFLGHEILRDLLHLAAAKGYDIRVKDCSLGLRLPVLGLLIRDGTGRYAFHLGADPSPVTALERCFTEMCQGGQILFLDAAEIVDDPAPGHLTEFWKTQLHLNIRCYEGHWPHAVLQPGPDGVFAGFDHPVSASDEQDLDYVLGIVRDAGWELLVRDNSFLGFPAYHVYVPGVGEMANAVDDSFVRQYLSFDRQIHVLTQPVGATLAQREAAVQAMERYAAAAPSRRFQAADYLLYCPCHPWIHLSLPDLRELLLSQRVAATAVPPCFHCDTCPSAGSCHFPLLSAVWKRLKQTMISSGLTQDDLRRLAPTSQPPAPEGKGRMP